MELHTIIGNLTADPVRRAVTVNGQAKEVADFTIAVNTKHSDREATYYRCTAWDKQAPPILQYLHRGDKVAVTSRKLTGRAYTPKDGGEPKAVLEMAVDSCEFLWLKSKAEESKEPVKDGGMTVVDEEMPF